MVDSLSNLESMVAAGLANRQGPTGEDIRKLIGDLRQLSMFDGVTEDDAERLAKLFEERVSITQHLGSILIERDHQPWRWQFLRVMRLIRLPDLSGAWAGTIASSYSGFEKVQQVTVTIEQKWTRMVVHLNAEESRSWSVTASVLTNAPEGLVLIYLFDNEPKAESVETMHRFRGTAVLVSAAHGLLEGYYYTGRGRETHGSLKLCRNRDL